MSITRQTDHITTTFTPVRDMWIYIMHFKEMGVFGSPLRQSLSFDLYDKNEKLIAHDAIVSVDKMEKLSRPGNLGTRHKLTIAAGAADDGASFWP